MIRRNASLIRRLFTGNPRPSIFLPLRASKWGIYVGILCTPLAVWGMYERFSPLPPPLSGAFFPLKARYYIRRALWTDNIQEKAYYLDQAMRTILSRGYGAASPQSTNLIIYLSQLYLDQTAPSINDLVASFTALTHKPHVGEGVTEEKARLEMSFRVADKLIDILPDEASRAEVAQKVLYIMDKCPPYLGSAWRHHPNREKFVGALHK